jgi:uncharacterized protein YjiS (DUF1127 family)
MNPLGYIKLALLWRREYRKARAELESASERELSADLRLNRSDIPDVAAEVADGRLAAVLRDRLGHRRASRAGFPPRAAGRVLAAYGAGIWDLAGRGPATWGVGEVRR